MVKTVGRLRGVGMFDWRCSGVEASARRGTMLSETYDKIETPLQVVHAVRVNCGSL